nr:hypothetical protein [Tanacetum cinerariifolium]
PVGIEHLSSNLQVAHTDVRILMLAWKIASGKAWMFHPGKENS